MKKWSRELKIEAIFPIFHVNLNIVTPTGTSTRADGGRERETAPGLSGMMGDWRIISCIVTTLCNYLLHISNGKSHINCIILTRSLPVTKAH